MIDIPCILLNALQRATADMDGLLFADIQPDTDVFELIDSFTVVNLLLETEMIMEEKTGKYVALADENTFDAKKSPLRKWSRWIEYVEECHEK